jgi:DNA-directed RNA polymerase subunit RPC12/RpoP
MIDFKDFKKDDGLIDWDRYREAQKSAGEACTNCGSFLLFNSNNNKPAICMSCKDLRNGAEEVTHSDYIRCSHCLEQISVDSLDYESGIYEDGDHEIFCPFCDEEMSFSTHIFFSYTSPPAKKSSDE